VALLSPACFKKYLDNHPIFSDNYETLYPIQFDSASDPLDNPGSLRVIGQEELLRENKMV
jgi:hypothetical protein